MKQSIELTPVQLVIVETALQDFARFSQDTMAAKCASDLFFKVEEIRRLDDKFFNASLAAAEMLFKPLVTRGQK